jgi:hypothetical protein
LAALRTCRPLPPGRFLVLISVRDLVDPRSIVRLETLLQFKNPMTSSGIVPAAFRLVAQCLNQLRYRVRPRRECILVEIVKLRECSGYLDARGRIILKLKSQNGVGLRTGLIWLIIGTSVHSSVLSGFIKCGEILE